MHMTGQLCRAVFHDPGQTQRQLAKRMGVSLGKCHGLIRGAVEAGYITESPAALVLTERGRELLEQYRMENAIIMAASIDVRFVPFTHETPKSLMEIEGERIIERQIRQLNRRGITDITVVVGYLAEKFEYLTDKYGVKLVFNPEYTTKNNIASLYLTRHLLGNTYLLTADHWIWENIFQQYEPNPWFCCHWHEGATNAWTCQTNGRGRILGIRRGGRDKLTMRGPVCFTRELARELAPLIEKEYLDGLETERWETVLQGHFDEMNIYAHVRHPDMVQNFHTLDELRDFDLQYAEQSGNHNLRQIASIFDVPEGLIRNLTWLDVGMTNRSFRFELDGKAYIYRIPGEGSENFISRRQESVVYKAIGPLDIADEVIYFDPATGIKISRFYENEGNVDDRDWERIETCMGILRTLHQARLKVKHTFDIEDKLTRYEAMCRKVDCVRFEDFEKTRQRVETPLRFIRERGGERVLCHVDPANNNFLLLKDGSIRLIDWEYGGMCHPLSDVAMFATFSNYPPQDVDRLLGFYLGREPNRHERMLTYSYCACAGLLWSLWAEYRQYYGEDFGEYAMQQYRIAKTFSKLVEQLLAEEQAELAAAPAD